MFQTIFTLPQTVKTHEVDLYRTMTVPTMLNGFQEVATRHANHLGFGFFDLIKANRIWALSRLHVEINTYPQWLDDVEFKTWTNGVAGIFANRNWELIHNGEVMVKAFSDWLVLDMQTRRPQRIDWEDFAEKTIPDVATVNKTKKLKPADDFEVLGEVNIVPSQMDMNGHVNNVFYLTWILDCLGMEWTAKYEAEVIDLNYMKEIRSTVEKVEVLANADKTLFSVCSEGTPSHVLVEISWREK